MVFVPSLDNSVCVTPSSAGDCAGRNMASALRELSWPGLDQPPIRLLDPRQKAQATIRATMSATSSIALCRGALQFAPDSSARALYVHESVNSSISVTILALIQCGEANG
jgi:hypothetical protein